MSAKRKRKSKSSLDKSGLIKKIRSADLLKKKPKRSTGFLGQFSNKFLFIMFFLTIVFAGYFLIRIFIFASSGSYSLIFASNPSVAIISQDNLNQSSNPALVPSMTPGKLPSYTLDSSLSFTPILSPSVTPGATVLPSLIPVSIPVSTISLSPTPAFVPTPIIAPSSTFIPAPSPLINSVNYKYGISSGNTLPGLSDSELNKIFDDFVSLKIGWLRFDIDWQNIQFSDSSKFDWQNIDRIVEAANARHIKLLPVLAYTPKWARPESCSDSPNCPPADLNNYTIFIEEAVRRYKPKGIYSWEIWNEPNLIWYWRPAPSASQYFEMLKASHIAIKQIDPSAYVVLGGIGPGDIKKGDMHQLDFLKELYKLGAQPYFEVLGFHPYSYPVPASYFQTWSAWSQMEETPVSIRSIIRDYDDETKPIWFTEFGAPTNGPGYGVTSNSYNLLFHPDHVTEELQAEILRDSFDAAGKIPWAGPLFWYSYKDLGTDSASNENFFGLLRYDGTKKPAYEMLSNILSR